MAILVSEDELCARCTLRTCLKQSPRCLVRAARREGRLRRRRWATRAAPKPDEVGRRVLVGRALDELRTAGSISRALVERTLAAFSE